MLFAYTWELGWPLTRSRKHICLTRHLLLETGASLDRASASAFNLLPLSKDTAGCVQLDALSESRSILQVEHSNEAGDISSLILLLRLNVLSWVLHQGTKNPPRTLPRGQGLSSDSTG